MTLLIKIAPAGAFFMFWRENVTGYDTYKEWRANLFLWFIGMKKIIWSYSNRNLNLNPSPILNIDFVPNQFITGLIGTKKLSHLKLARRHRAFQKQATNHPLGQYFLILPVVMPSLSHHWLKAVTGVFNVQGTHGYGLLCCVLDYFLYRLCGLIAPKRQ